MRIEHLSELEIQELLDDSFSAPVHYRRHVMVCEKCQETLLDYELLAAQLNGASVPDALSDNFTQNVLEQISPVDIRGVSRRRWYLMSSIGAAAAIIVATGAAFIIDLQPLLPGVRDLLLADISGKLQTIVSPIQHAFTPSQALAYGAAATVCLAASSLVEALLLRPIKARLSR